MHELKEKLRRVFNKTNDWYPAVFKLGIWLSKAKKYLGATLLGRRCIIKE
jgi:hypothetical protein